MINAQEARELSKKVIQECFSRQLEVVEAVIREAANKGMTCCTATFDFVSPETQTIRSELVENGYNITGWDNNFVCISWR